MVKRLVLTALIMACGREPSTPRFAAMRLSPIDSVLDISRAAEFVPALGDSQRLMLGSYPNGRHGPRVQIAPARYAYAHERSDLNSERLLGRIVNFDSVAYPKLFLEPFDTVYVWSDRLSTVIPEGRALLVSTRQRLIVERRLTFHPGPGFRATQPAARFLWDDEDEKTCIWCTWAEWCVIQ